MNLRRGRQGLLLIFWYYYDCLIQGWELQSVETLPFVFFFTLPFFLKGPNNLYKVPDRKISNPSHTKFSEYVATNLCPY